MRTRAMILFVTALFLSACATATPGGSPAETSPDFLVPVGSTLVLHQPLQIPAWQDQVYFQDGQTMSWRGVNIYIPYCTLKMQTKKETAQSIRPDTFVVKESYTELFFMQVQAPVPPAGMQPAAAGWGPVGPIGFETREAMDYKVVAAVLELGAADQPDVTRMLCTDWGLPQERAHITVAKMRRSLGAVMTLQLAPPPGKN